MRRTSPWRTSDAVKGKSHQSTTNIAEANTNIRPHAYLDGDTDGDTVTVGETVGDVDKVTDKV